MRCSACLVGLVALNLALVGCPAETDGDACRVSLQVRQSDPSPLSNADTLRTFVFDGGRAVHAGEVALTSTEAGTGLDLIADDTSPVVGFSTDFEVVLSAYRSGQTTVGAFGRSHSFACEGEAEITVPIYLGPAMGFGSTVSEPEARHRGTATTLGDNRVLIYGGQTPGGSPVTPVADIYDHTSGLACAVAAGCPQGTPEARVGHSATLLDDGRVLIVGGQEPANPLPTSAFPAVIAIERYDPVSGSIQAIAGASLNRSFHAAVLLEGPEIPAAKRGQLLIVGGLTGEAIPNNASGDLFLLDPRSGVTTLVGALPAPRWGHSAVLLSGARVLIAGGYNAGDALSATAYLFDIDAETLLPAAVDAPCPSVGGAATADLCALRAVHTATALENGNVLLWGGDVLPVSGGEDPAPEAEVYVAAERRFVPLRLPVAMANPRIGHSVTPITCFRAPCPLLVAGGEDPATPSLAHPPYLVTAPQGIEVVDGAFDATVVPFSGTVTTSLRAYHAAAALPDGSVLLTGGIRANADQLMLEGAVFSYCEDVATVGGVGCPQP